VSDAIDHNKAFVRKNIRIPVAARSPNNQRPDAVVCPRARIPYVSDITRVSRWELWNGDHRRASIARP